MCIRDRFQNCGEVLESYQERFRYIMVDEYQDTNTAQFKFVSILASRYENLCVVGDDDQSIYKFRGANIGNILGFEQVFPEAKVIRLEQNYRSTQNIPVSYTHLEHVRELTPYLEEKLDALVDKYEIISRRRGKGFMQGLVIQGISVGTIVSLSLIHIYIYPAGVSALCSVP